MQAFNSVMDLLRSFTEAAKTVVPAVPFFEIFNEEVKAEQAALDAPPQRSWEILAMWEEWLRRQGCAPA